MIDWFRLILAVGLIFLIGYFISLLLLKEEKNQFFLWFGLGTGFISLQLFIISWLGFKFNLYNLFLPWFCFILIVGWTKRKILFASEKPNRARKWKWIEIILMLMILLSVGLVGFNALFLPMHEWDAIAIWGYKAKVLFQEPIKNSGYFLDLSKSYSHLNYPLLLPFTEVWFYSILGRVDDRLVKIIFPLLFISLSGLLYHAQRRFFSRCHCLLFTAMFVSLPTILSRAHLADADLALAFFYSVGAIYLYLWIRNPSQDYIIISSFFSAFASLTKNEGLGLLLINIFVLIVFIFFNRNKQRLKQLALSFLIVILVSSPWLIFSAKIPKTHENYLAQLTTGNILANLNRIPIIAGGFLRTILDPGHWNILWILLLVVIILQIKTTFKPPTVYLFGLLVLPLLLYGAIYVITPWEVHWLMKWSLNRLLIHVALLVVFLVSHQVAEFRILK